MFGSRITTGGFIVFSVLLQLAMEISSPHPWSYAHYGGVAGWPGVCQTGSAQSPIDIQPSIVVNVHDASELHFHGYDQPTNWEIADTEHNVQLSWKVPPSTGSNRVGITAGGLSCTYYSLQQLHFHWGSDDTDGSEHSVAGKHYPLEAHFVHKCDRPSTNQYAVVAVFFAVDGAGREDTLMARIAKRVAEFTSASRTHRAHKLPMPNVTLKSLLPNTTENFYRYNGSLTTPDCAEVVEWTVLANPVSITHSQLKAFRDAKRMDGSVIGANHRPTQGLNGRRIELHSPQIRKQSTTDQRAAAGNSTPTILLGCFCFLLFLLICSLSCSLGVFF